MTLFIFPPTPLTALRAADVRVKKFIITEYAYYTLVLFQTSSIKPFNTLHGRSKPAQRPEILQGAAVLKSSLTLTSYPLLPKCRYRETRNVTAEFPLYTL